MKSCKNPIPTALVKATTTDPLSFISKQKLGETFDAVHSFAMRFFYQNLNKSVLEDGTVWEHLRNRITWLPLLPSNSPDAKRMRVAACIGKLGSMLAELIFVPVYVNPDMGEVRSLLTDLYVTDTDHLQEKHLRGVLLSVLPDVQQDIKTKRIQKIIEKISLIFDRLLDDETRDEFKEELVQTCKVAAECWGFVRQAQIKVDTVLPVFQNTEETAEQFTDMNWLPVPLGSSTTTAAMKNSEHGDSQKKGGPKLNGTAKQTGNGNAMGGPKQSGIVQTATNGEEQQVAFDHKSVHCPVWPSFDVGDELVKGYVLLATQVQAAREERGTRRMQRQARRNSSVQPKAAFLC